MNAQDIEKEDRSDVAEAERRLADPAEVPIPYEQARCVLFPSSGKGLDASDIESLVAPVTAPDVVEDADGWLTDVETGAVVGNVYDRFQVDSLAGAEWALKVRSQIEGDIVALDAQEAAIRENFRTLRQEKVQRLSWWDWRFRSQVEDFARRMLSGGKKRTWTCPWGRVSFRKSKGSTEILDPQAAVAFVRAWDPKRVKVVESVTATTVRAVLAEMAQAYDEPIDVPGWLKSTVETESVRIDTGIHINESKKGADENGD